MTLIIGKSGQVGHELCRLIAGAAVDYPEIDLTDPASIRSVLAETKPKIILNAAAYTAVDKAETEMELARAINAEAPAFLAEEAKKSGALLVHYSTEYIFDGMLHRPYREEDRPNPMSVYGRTKWEGDLAIQMSGCRYLILRTSWVYGSRGNNFLLTMLRLQQQNRQIRVVEDQIGAPTWCRHLAEATVRLLQEEGVYNVAASGSTSWCGFARAIFEEAGIAHPVEGIPTEAYPTAAKRPKNCRLDLSKLVGAGILMPDWREALKQCLEDMKVPV